MWAIHLGSYTVWFFRKLALKLIATKLTLPQRLLRLGSISRSVRFCQLNPMISIRNVTHSERSNTQYLHAVGTCTGNWHAALIWCPEYVWECPFSGAAQPTARAIRAGSPSYFAEPEPNICDSHYTNKKMGSSCQIQTYVPIQTKWLFWAKHA